MRPLNRAFILLLAVAGVAFIGWFLYAFSGADAGIHTGNFFSEIIELFWEFGISILFSAIIGSFLLWLGFFVFLLIFLPHQFTKSIEAGTYRRKYLDERERNQSNS